jgi:hypothetical protein
MIVRWEAVCGTPIVTALATTWTPKDQQDFLASRESLQSLADAFARQWAPANSSYVAEMQRGGDSALFAYRSQALRQAQGISELSPVEAGDLYVIIVLDTSLEDQDAPIALAEPVNMSDLEETVFSIGLVLGHPWRDASSQSNTGMCSERS